MQLGLMPPVSPWPLSSEERRRQRTVKYHIVKRQLTESGAPERRLSWDAMEQIR